MGVSGGNEDGMANQEPAAADVVVQSRGPVWVIQLNRESRRNAVDRPTAEALAAAFREFDADEDACVAVFHGLHGNFCAGADLQAIAQGRLNRVEPDGDGPMGPTRALLSKPVIAAIEGHAVAGGLELALWCDMRVVAEDAIFGVFCRRWGVPLIDGGTVRLPRIIGLGRAMDMVLTGRPVDAAEAFAMGLANRVVPSGQTLEAALALAHELARFPQLCMRNDRLSAYEQHDMSLQAALANEFERGKAAVSEEAVAGATRFKDGAGRHGKF